MNVDAVTNNFRNGIGLDDMEYSPMCAAYMPAIDADILDELKKQVSLGDIAAIQSMDTSAAKSGKNYVLTVYPYFEKSVLDAATSVVHAYASKNGCGIPEHLLREALSGDSSVFTHRIAEKFRDRVITVPGGIPSRSFNANNILFIHQDDRSIRLEYIVGKSGRTGCGFGAPPMYTQDKSGRIHSYYGYHADKIEPQIWGVGYFPLKLKRSFSNVDIVPMRWVSDGEYKPVDNSVECPDIYGVFGDGDSIGIFRNPDLAEAYVLLFNEKICGSALNPMIDSIPENLRVWENVINGPSTLADNRDAVIQQDFAKAVQDIAQHYFPDSTVDIAGALSTIFNRSQSTDVDAANSPIRFKP